MHTLSFEKAKALKDAGFQQPEFATGQKWYNSFGAVTYIGRHHVSEDGKTHSFVCMSDSGRVDTITPVHEGAFYIPTEGELLAAIKDYDLYVNYDSWHKLFILTREIDENIEYTSSKSLIDLLADAYLILYNDKTKTGEESI